VGEGRGYALKGGVPRGDVKLLIATYFFPPAGGGGAHRPLKLAAHLPHFGVATDVLAPTDPKWVERDETLRPPPGVRIHRVRYLGPRTRLRGAELHGRHGLSRVRSELSFLLPRLLMPDQHAAWALTAGPAAVRLVRKERFDAVLTTSPPTSVHLIGALVKRLTGARWIADLRDPIVAHPHRRVELAIVRAKERSEQAAARLVARYADAIVAASSGVATQIEQLAPAAPVTRIANGCDFEDFDGLDYRRGDRFRITHTGMMFGKRSPRAFIRAVASSDADIVARFVGGFRQADLDWAHAAGLDRHLDVRPYVSHRAALELQRDSEALLLLIPETDGRGRGVLSAKVFEYLAARRPIVAAVPPEGEAADLIRSTGAGLVVPPDDVDALRDAVLSLERRWQVGELDDVQLTREVRAGVSRRARAGELAHVVRGLA
jgi:glycosyltransferase involved in cell wall biosynthesis